MGRDLRLQQSDAKVDVLAGQCPCAAFLQRRAP
jgi:hypothetical protein